ncbi:hypothetical protein MASR2M15_05210 [Anaerolineales bacterium]
MKLLNRDHAIVSKAKIVHYLLDLTSENGKGKAVFFMRFGFTIESWEVLAETLKQHANDHEVTKVEERPPLVHTMSSKVL